jgi:hypothetical protein
MNLSMPRVTQACEDIPALRRIIAHLSERCCFDLTDRSTVRFLLDGDFSACQAFAADRQTFQDLRAMLILLFRIESSSSEDLGIAGLRTLWRQHSEIVARTRVREPKWGELPLELAAH